MIRKSDLQRIVTEALSLQASGEVGYDTPLALDSFSFVLLQHLLEERHGIEFEPEQVVLNGFASVRDIHLCLAANFPADVEAPTAASTGKRPSCTPHTVRSEPAGNQTVKE
ncbi:acyl carrier protein [Streptomyces sp. NPDC007100]|uniref:acyl carrier protein n=1 Tax=unclassified Streptomyces TaxID=2593676 RepID=UPI0033D3662D